MIKLTISLFVVLFSLCISTHAQKNKLLADKKITGTEVWRAAEFTLTSAKVYTHPFEEVEVAAEFTGPSNEIIKRPAFWDGGNVWKIRFAPTATGVWKMITICSDSSNKGLHKIQQSITCKKYAGNADVYKHGFLKVSDNKRYFVYADGTPFFYLGDTHWIFIHERFNSSNVKGIPSQFKYIVDKRVAQGFTVYQSEAIQHPHGQNTSDGGGNHSGKDEEAYCNFRDGFDENDLAGFRNIDRKFKYIADKGMVNANSSICWALDPAEFPASYSEKYMYQLSRYWTARYGAYPVMWKIGQEIDKNMYKKYDSVSINKWFAVGKAIDDNDGYHHPLTAHMENTSHTRANDSWWSDKTYHNWWGIQWQAGINDDLFSVAKNFWNNTSTKPSVLYESAYEGFWTDAKGAREAGYKAFQNGMYGYGYGANGVWNDLYSKKPPDYGTDYEMPVRYLSWFDGANLPGAQQLTHFKKFYTALNWWKLMPRFDDTTWSTFVDKNQSFIATDEQQTFVVYFSNKVPSTGDLKNLAKNKNYSAEWFNTRNGIYTSIGTFRTINGTWSVPDKPDSDDWILLVIKI
jgi:Protein of unknown function (DUF4038)/Domain of unknown function (DUF5060)/Putative collagen-binding domain of a collagenase